MISLKPSLEVKQTQLRVERRIFQAAAATTTRGEKHERNRNHFSRNKMMTTRFRSGQNGRSRVSLDNRTTPRQQHDSRPCIFTAHTKNQSSNSRREDSDMIHENGNPLVTKNGFVEEKKSITRRRAAIVREGPGLIQNWI